MRPKRVLSFLGAVVLLSAAPFFSAAKGPGSPSASGSQLSSSNSETSPNTQSQSKAGTKKTSRKSRRSRRRERGQKAPTPQRIQEIQAALAHEGTYQGQPSGKWDAGTVEAMKRFQSAQGLSPTGKLDALTLQKLGLGSEVAGRAAPRPPAQPLPGTIAKPH
jgi:peptidoglycan hydrolase-like protein with peptidoglycan-binding domain